MVNVFVFGLLLMVLVVGGVVIGLGVIFDWVIVIGVGLIFVGS